MKITRISVSRLPGIDRPFEIESISPGLNIILGPNGAGKSSICRVIRQSLWPSIPLPRTRVRIAWDDEGADLISELDGGVTWQRRGENASAPEVAPGHLARCYTVTLRDLLEDKNPDDIKMADDIRILMAGGYNLTAVKKLFPRKKSPGKSEARVLTEAIRALERLQIERRGLSEDEDKLSFLQEELDAARTATRECELLTLAMEMADRRRELITLQADIEGFPPGMAGLQGNERIRIREIEEEIEELKESISRKSREAEEAEKELIENELPEGEVDEDIIRIEDERVHRLEQLARERERQEKELKLREGAITAAEAALGIQAKKSRDFNPDKWRLDDVDAWARKAIRLKDRREGIGARLAALPPSAGVDRKDLDRVRRASDLLGDWLSSPGSTATPPIHPLLRLFAALAVPAGVILAILINPWFFLLGGLGLGILLMSFLPGKAGGDQQSLLRDQFEKLDLPHLSSWQRSDVSARLRELREEIRQGELDLSHGVERDRLQGELRMLEDEGREIEDARAEICRDTGIDPAATELAIVDYIDRLRAFREAFRARASARTSAKIAEDSYEEALKKAQNFIYRTLGKKPGDDLEARHLMTSIKERSGRLRTARLRLESAQTEIADRETELARKQTRIEGIFRMAGIELSKKPKDDQALDGDRKSTRLNSSHTDISRMPSSA